MITEADDDGRLVGDLAQLRALILPYYAMPLSKMEMAVGEIASTGLIQRYESDGIPYIAFQSWADHQKRDTHHYKESKLPTPPEVTRQSLNGDSAESPQSLAGDDTTGTGKGREGKGPPYPVTPGRDWPSPEALVAKYNAETPSESPSAVTLSAARRHKCRQYLAAFPSEAWWQEVFAQMHRSRFLRGLTPKQPGRERFVADLDWLLTKGKDGTENAVKVHDGRYQDG
jgi:hypothetical protein